MNFIWFDLKPFVIAIVKACNDHLYIASYYIQVITSVPVDAVVGL